MEIRYLYNSGFSVKTQNHMLIFDYYLDYPLGSFAQGVINTREIRDENVVVFVSHQHSDHYNPVIFDWHKRKKMRYILSSDVPKESNEYIWKMGPDERLELPDMTIHTVKSNDEGVAYFIETDGYVIYHGGDLNWWHWEDEPEQYNRQMAESYKQALEGFKGKPVDVAFIPVDPRLGDATLWGLDYFMKNIGAEYIIPMHFGTSYSIFEQIENDPVTEPYRKKIAQITKRGQRLIFNKD